jgi:hypothetical protein
MAFGLSTVFAVCASAALLTNVGSAFAQIDPIVTAGISKAVPVGAISHVAANKLQVTVGEAVTVSVSGHVQAGRSCQIYIFPGYVSNNDLDAGLVSIFPHVASNVPIKFSKPGKYTIRAYSATSNHFCSYDTSTNGVDVTVTEGVNSNPGLTVAPANSVKVIQHPVHPKEPVAHSVPPDPYRK